jgi:hypothetical protein
MLSQGSAASVAFSIRKVHWSARLTTALPIHRTILFIYFLGTLFIIMMQPLRGHSLFCDIP